MFEGKYTTMGSRSTLHPRVVKAQLNHHLGSFHFPGNTTHQANTPKPMSCLMCKKKSRTHSRLIFLPVMVRSCKCNHDQIKTNVFLYWTEVNVVSAMTQIVARVSSRMVRIPGYSNTSLGLV